MSSWKVIKGRIGVARVMLKLAELRLDSTTTPSHWRFDLVTENGLKLEVKFANVRKAVSGTGYKYDTYTFVLSKKELKILDFLILVFNTDKGCLFYIIPQKDITSTTLSFNPFSNQDSKYRKYADRWDLIVNKGEVPEAKETNEIKKNGKKKTLHDY